MSASGLPILDCDAHVAEPPDLWESDYMQSEYRGASPFRFVDRTDPLGRPTTALFDRGELVLDSAVYTCAAGVPLESVAAGLRYTEGNPGGWDSAARVADMDAEGIDHQVVNPSTPGLRVGFVPDVGLAAAMCRAWNDWVSDHCAASHGRVSANLILPWQDDALARDELERVSDRPWFRGVVMRPAPAYPNGFVGDAVFDPLYSMIEERGLVLVFHTATFREGPLGDITAHYARTRPSWHATFYGLIFAFPIEGWTAYAQLVFEGVLDRHTELKVMLTESHGGWLVTALERMDEYARGGEALRAAYSMNLQLLPSEYFERQGFVTFEGDEVALGFAASHIGRSMVWASDYPHADATLPGAVAALEETLAPLEEGQRRAIAWDNGARAFAIPLTRPPAERVT